jgi:hypothetical protein
MTHRSAHISQETSPVTVLWQGDVVVKTVPELSEVIAAVEKSKYMLDYQPDWDGEGSVGYDVATWTRASRFLVRYAQWVFDVFGKVIPQPSVLHGPQGSIDIYWRNPEFHLLINVPADATKLATFYGDNYKSQSVEGKFDLEDFKLLLMPALI